MNWCNEKYNYNKFVFFFKVQMRHNLQAFLNSTLHQFKVCFRQFNPHKISKRLIHDKNNSVSHFIPNLTNCQQLIGSNLKIVLCLFFLRQNSISFTTDNGKRGWSERLISKSVSAARIKKFQEKFDTLLSPGTTSKSGRASECSLLQPWNIDGTEARWSGRGSTKARDAGILKK